VLRPEDIPRFAQLGVIANVQPLWATREPGGEDLAVGLVGAERAAWQYPFRSLQETGTAMAMGSDWPVSTHDPLQIVHVAVNRVGPGLTVEPLDSTERLSLDDALAHYTVGSAFANFAEEETGSISPGMAADLVVLDANVHALAAADIFAVKARATIVKGEVVHGADA
jgi:predicted amidohydrolase YtcJ